MDPDSSASPMEVEKRESPLARNEMDDNAEEADARTAGAAVQDDDDDPEPALPKNKFHPKQRVYAKDASSGLWYEAVIRRSLFGVNNNKQVQIGLVCTESEINDILEQAAKEPIWHYFVHYNKWAVNWDRWVSEEDIMEATEESKLIADRYVKEHKELQKELKKTKGRKSDGASFLKEWRKRMDRIEEDMKKEEEEKKKAAAIGEKGTRETTQESSDTKKDEKAAATKTAEEKPVVTPAPQQPKPKPKKKKQTSEKVWDNATLEREYKLKLRGLESKRSSQDQHKMALPFSLKKVMVEAWEIITQCEMVPNLPASVTVRQFLDKYLKSKLDLIHASKTATKPVEETATANVSMDTKETTSPEKDTGGDAKVTEADANQKKLEKKKQEWTDMVEGIAMFFDEALPFRLLYSQELPQFKVVESTFVVPVVNATVADGKADEHTTTDANDDKVVKDESMPDASSPQSEAGGAKTDDMPVKNENSQTHTTAPAEAKAKAPQDAPIEVNAKSNKTTNSRKSKGSAGDGFRPMLPCEVYGCEHLLRLCLKIPDLLAEQLPKLSRGDAVEVEARKAYENESKQILAKVNDLIRFLHKHQSTMFADSYRKMNEAELREEQKWVRYIERKRKRALEEKQEAMTVANAKEEVSAPTTSTDEKVDSREGAKSKLQKVS